VFGGYTYLNASSSEGTELPDGIGNTTGKVPLNTPKDSGNLWTTYTIKEWEIGGGPRSMSASATPTTPTRWSFRPMPALDLTAGIQAAHLRRAPQRVQPVQLAIYYDASSARTAAARCRGSGLTAMLTLNYRL
jgi:catecholate siderophore receptor